MALRIWGPAIITKAIGRMFNWFTAGPFGWAVGTYLAADRCDSWSDSFLAELLGDPLLAKPDWAGSLPGPSGSDAGYA
jgi:hypothetical protein